MTREAVRLDRHRAHLPARRPLGTVLLSVRGASAHRGERAVLVDADLDVRAGEVVALVGPNGAGKSSLLAAVAGDLDISGSIDIDGHPVAGRTAGELARLRSVLPQHPAVAFPFLVRDVVEMGRAPWRSFGLPDEDQRVDEALAIADVEAFAHRPVTSLSGGERARVALARVLAQGAQLLLLDEPTAALDIAHQELVMRTLTRRAAAGDAVLVVLHDLSLAAAHAHRIVVLDGGRVVADGPPSDVAEPELLERVYRTPVAVMPHPVTGAPVIVPHRGDVLPD